MLAVGACGSDASSADKAEVRRAVLQWFRAAQGGDADLAALMASTCAPQQVAMMSVLIPKLAPGAEVSKVDVTIDGEHATAAISVLASGREGTSSPLPLVREGDTWKVECAG